MKEELPHLTLARNMYIGWLKLFIALCMSRMNTKALWVLISGLQISFSEFSEFTDTQPMSNEVFLGVYERGVYWGLWKHQERPLIPMTEQRHWLGWGERVNSEHFLEKLIRQNGKNVLWVKPEKVWNSKGVRGHWYVMSLGIMWECWNDGEEADQTFYLEPCSQLVLWYV